MPPTAVSASRATIQRTRLRVRGVVQGVGFRPFVYRLATELHLAGQVGNDAEGVFVEVEGPAVSVALFRRRLVDEPPPLARVTAVDAVAVDVVGEQGFRIAESRVGVPVRTFVPPDTAVCDDCLRELFDPADRRYRYPFITCTNCGPRFTITITLPYDRPNTTMSGFALCTACADEYHDPTDRRFHAQPLACAACGPRVWFDHPGGRVDGADSAIQAAQRVIAAGGIVAIKGLGGYHLACDARSDAAVATLRRRKHRPDKPFAVMTRDVPAAELIAEIGRAELELLTSPQRPIVLLRTRGSVSPLVAPGNPFAGVMLPYTPLHHLLFDEVSAGDAPVPDTLVMTSGNLTDEPICYRNDDARRRLSGIADAWLQHDRPIHVPCDDSVMRVDHGTVVPIRRSRGYVPLPVALPFEVAPTLAVGGELKNTFCLAKGRDAWMSQHFGDMGGTETMEAFQRSTNQFRGLYEVSPAMIAADAHPGYHTRLWAEEQTSAAITFVQHHHAHVAALMVEHDVPEDEQLIGCVFDGTGYGPDGAIWGGEILVASYGGFERAAHLRYVPLPGGDATIRRPSRAALAHLWAAGIVWDEDLPPVSSTPAQERTVLARQLDRGVLCVPTSSMGRLFDAVSSLLGLRHIVSYEAQAAIELELVAAPDAGIDGYRFSCPDAQTGVIEVAGVLRRIVADVRAGRAPGVIAAAFHEAVAELLTDQARSVRARTGIERVALTGGVFQNLLLTRRARALLTAAGFQVLTHELVPPNDGGLALGQLAVAAHRAARSGGTL